jgi:Fe2+ or Zn2+ uptake regulation protein
LLKRQAKTLEDTRALLIGERSSNETYDAVLKREPKLSLQTEILRCFEGRRERLLSVMEVVMLLRNRRYPGSDSKNFYVNVYTTLKRLGAKGKIAEIVLESQRKAYRVIATEQFDADTDVEGT